MNKMLRVLCALSFLIVLLPLVILGIILIWIETRDRCLFKQVRVGKNLRTFRLTEKKQIEMICL
ncbi:MAG: sugar transferase [Candidatus Latescibacteria bacterium]|nr:sugar transferase [Candidatus Latescibacterota bacterium]